MAFQSIYASACAQPDQDSVFWKALGWGERMGASVLLLTLSPVLIVSSVVVWGLSRRSPLVAHRRVGQGRRVLWTLKLRTMWPQPGGSWKLVERIVEHPGTEIKASADERVVSRFARFCRHY